MSPSELPLFMLLVHNLKASLLGVFIYDSGACCMFLSFRMYSFLRKRKITNSLVNIETTTYSIGPYFL